MPKNVSIPITDDATCSCSSYYEASFYYGTNAPTVIVFNSPLPTETLNTIPGTPFIYLPNLIDGQTYNFSITRHCTNSTVSAPLTDTFDT